MTTPDARSLAGWAPVRFFVQDGQPTVEWCQLGVHRLSAPFFAQTVQAARATHCPVRLTPADVLAEFAATPPDLPLAGLIFHLSRCGSTLVSRMLAALPAHLVLSEAGIMESVLHGAAESPGVSDATRIGWLRGLVHAFGTRRFPAERRMFIKLEPWHTLDREMIRAAFPQVLEVFIYRDPVEILVSQSDSVAGTFAPTPHHAAQLGLTYVEALSITKEEYVARALGRFAGVAADAAEGDPSLGLVHYPQLPAAVEMVIAPWFGLTLDDPQRETMRAMAAFHAKAPGKLPFQADSARKQRDADDTTRELAARWINPAYTRLEAARFARSIPPPR